jgi:hypothetical protein
LNTACNSDPAKVTKVKACLTTVFPAQPKPDAARTEQARKAFTDGCAAKTACEAKLGACKAIMDKRRQDMCKCGLEIAPQRQTLMQSEPACASLPQKQGGPGPARKQHDCNSQKEDFCAKGFDAMIASRPQPHH